MRHMKKEGSFQEKALIVLAIALVLRLIIAGLSHVSGDACWHISVGKFIARTGHIPLYEPLGRPVFWSPPLFNWFIAFFFKVGSWFSPLFASGGIMLISVLFGLGTLIYTYKLAKEVANEKAAFLAVVFLSFLPIHIYLSAIPYNDTMISFFAIAAVYHAIRRQYIIASILTGLGLLTKYTGFFILPVIILIALINESKKIRAIERSVMMTVISLAIGLPWYLRNQILLGNPLWPKLTRIFGDKTGFVETVFPSTRLSFENLFHGKHLVRTYLELFGVPAGHVRNLYFLKIPFIDVLIALWLLGTFIYLFPAIIGLFKTKWYKKKNLYLVMVLLSFSVFFFVSILFNDLTLTRYLLPALPVLAIVWASGFESMPKPWKVWYVGLFVILIIGFSGIEIVKAKIVEHAWGQYDNDFAWIWENTPQNAIFLSQGDNCYAYNFDRLTEQYNGVYDIDTIFRARARNITYVYVNQKWTLTGDYDGNPLLYDKDFLEELDHYATKVYDNQETGSMVYQLKK